jgi:hypothetical protein
MSLTTVQTKFDQETRKMVPFRVFERFLSVSHNQKHFASTVCNISLRDKHHCWFFKKPQDELNPMPSQQILLPFEALSVTQS